MNAVRGGALETKRDRNHMAGWGLDAADDRILGAWWSFLPPAGKRKNVEER
jgi:hypothetical protein